MGRESDVVYEKLAQMSLKTFINHLVSEMKCFNQLFNFLRFEYDKLKYLEKITLTMENSFCANYEYHDLSESIEEVVTVNNMYNEGCDFIGGLYEYCFETIIIINDNLSEKLSEIHKLLFLIEAYLLVAVEMYTNERIRKIASNIIPFIHYTGKILFKQYNVAIAKRFVLAIMTELNYYGLEYCNPPKYNYLFFNNIQFDNVGMHMTIEDKWVSFFTTIDDNYDQGQSKPDRHSFSSLAGVFKTYKSIVNYSILIMA